MFHGGGWAEGDRATALYPWLNPLLAAHGFVAASVSYRLSRFAPFPAQIYDAKAAIRWLRANASIYDIDTERIGVWGHSAGGHLAALLGTSAEVAELEGPCGSPGYSSSVQAVIAYAAPTDFTCFHPEDENEPGSVPWLFFGGPPVDHPHLAWLASPVSHVCARVPPFLLVHGTADETVPLEQTRVLANELRRRGGDVTVREVPGVYHNLPSDMDGPLTEEPWADLGHEALGFFSKHLLGAIP